MSADALAHARASRRRHVGELAELVRFPTVGVDPARRRDMDRCAGWLARHLSGIGLDRVRTWPTGGHPVVYGEWLRAPDRPTVLVYGHYDVQPVDPVEEWSRPPFSGVVADGYLHGRGSSDDKGQLFAHVKALESWMVGCGGLPLNVKCLFEGEEEMGSPGLPAFVAEHARMLRADVAVVSDGAMLGPGRPVLTYGMRGQLHYELSVEGAPVDLHCGVFGGAVENPLEALCAVLGGLHDPAGRVRVPGFYDGVEAIASAERVHLARFGPSDDELARRAGAPPWGEDGFSSFERTTLRPAITINGVHGGYGGRGNKAIVPAHARAKLTVRLAPGQQPHTVDRLLRRHLALVASPALSWRIRRHVAAGPVTLDRGHPAVAVAGRALRRAFGRWPVHLRMGGTVPAVAIFARALGLPTLMIGLGLPGDRLHAPDERLHLPTFFTAVEALVLFLGGFAS